MEQREIRTTAPIEQRLPKEMAVYRLLEQLGIPYQCIDHPPVMDTTECYGVDKLLGINICKNLFLCNRKRTKYYLLTMPGSKRFDAKQLSRQLHIPRLSFAPEQDLLQILGLTPGSVTIMGLMHDTENLVQFLLDEDVYKEQRFGCHPCVNTTSMSMKSTDVWEKFLPAVHHDYTLVKLTE